MRVLFHFRFDFDGSLDNLSLENRKDKACCQTVEVCSSGTLHCFVLWWSLNLDEEEEIVLSMAPKIASQHPDKVLVSFVHKLCSILVFAGLLR